ncbi:cyclin-like protein [Xylariomycetidae sp. FL0641]|nr:cyclin-like protein [Xylariomycetidae sp. FL0641]
MDAKPCRPAAHQRVRGNENYVPQSKTIHQRNKSTGNLLNMDAAGNPNTTSKRNALADRNGTVRGSAAMSHAEAKAAVKNTAGSTMNTVKAKAQENRAKPAAIKEAFLQPAQRPTARPTSLASSASMSQLRSSIPAQRQPPKQTSRLTAQKGKPYIFRDEQLASERQKPSRESLVEEEPAAEESQVQKNPLAGALVPSTASQSIAPVAGTHQRVETAESIIIPAGKSGWESPYYHQFLAMSSAPKAHTDPSGSAAARSLNTQVVSGVTQGYEGYQRYEHPDGRIEFVRTYFAPAEETSDKMADAQQPANCDPSSTSRSAEAAASAAQVDLTSDSSDLEDGGVSKSPKSANNADGPIQPHAFEYLEASDDDELYEDNYDDQGYTTAHSYGYSPARGDNTTGGVTTVMLPPRLTKKGLAELKAAKQAVEAKAMQIPVDLDDETWDVSMVSEYGDEIFQYMRDLETDLLPNAHYMDIQTEIQWSMRAVMMDWVVQVHARFNLLPETLFLTVNYIDRFLSYKVVSLGKLQLVGATAILVASKYEEITSPSIQEIVYMVDGGYTPDEILKAERFMLSMLNFELGWPGPMSFLRRISKADDYHLETRTLAKYFIEVTIMDERFVASPPSYIAAGSHCLSRLILGRGDWSPAHVHYSGYTLAQLKPLVAMILECCRMAEKHHKAVFDKYADKRYKRASTFVKEQLANGFRLPYQRHVSYHHLDMLGDDATRVAYSGNHPYKNSVPVEG